MNALSKQTPFMCRGLTVILLCICLCGKPAESQLGFQAPTQETEERAPKAKSFAFRKSEDMAQWGQGPDLFYSSMDPSA